MEAEDAFCENLLSQLVFICKTCHCQKAKYELVCQDYRQLFQEWPTNNIVSQKEPDIYGGTVKSASSQNESNCQNEGNSVEELTEELSDLTVVDQALTKASKLLQKYQTKTLSEGSTDCNKTGKSQIQSGSSRRSGGKSSFNSSNKVLSGKKQLSKNDPVSISKKGAGFSSVNSAECALSHSAPNTPFGCGLKTKTATKSVSSRYMPAHAKAPFKTEPVTRTKLTAKINPQRSTKPTSSTSRGPSAASRVTDAGFRATSADSRVTSTSSRGRSECSRVRSEGSRVTSACSTVTSNGATVTSVGSAVGSHSNVSSGSQSFTQHSEENTGLPCNLGMTAALCRDVRSQNTDKGPCHGATVESHASSGSFRNQNTTHDLGLSFRTAAAQAHVTKQKRFLLKSEGCRLSLPGRYKKCFLLNERLRAQVNNVAQTPASVGDSAEAFMDRMQTLISESDESHWLRKVICMTHLYESLMELMDDMDPASLDGCSKWEDVLRVRTKLEMVLTAFADLEGTFQQIIKGSRASDWPQVTYPAVKPSRSTVHGPATWLPSDVIPNSVSRAASKLVYSGKKQLHRYRSLHQRLQLLHLELHVLSGLREALGWLQRNDASHRGYISVYRAVYSFTSLPGKSFPVVVKDTIEEVQEEQGKAG